MQSSSIGCDTGVRTTATPPPADPTKAWSDNWLSGQAKINRPAVSDAGGLSSATLPPADPTTAWSDNWLSGQANSNRPAVSEAGGLSTATLPPAAVAVAKGSNWNATSTMTDLPTASTSTTANSPVSATPLPVNPSTITFRAAPAYLSMKADAEGGSMERDTEPDSGAGAASPIASKQETTQPSSGVSSASVRTATPHQPGAVADAVANGIYWNSAHTMTGVQIASTPTTNLSSSPVAQQPVNPTGITLQAAPAHSSNQAHSDYDPVGGGLQARSDASAASRIVSQWEPAQSYSVVSSASARTSTTPRSANQPATAWAANNSNGPTNDNRPTVSDDGVQTTAAPPPTVPTKAWSANWLSGQTNRNRPAVSDAGVQTTAALPPAVPTKAWSENWLSGQAKVNRPAVRDAGVQTTAALAPAAVVVANGRTWHTTRTMTGVRIASTPVTAPSSTAATVAPASLPGIPIQAEPLNSSSQANADNGPMAGGSQTHSDAGAASRIKRLQERAQSSSTGSDVGAHITGTVPPTDQPVAWAADQSSQPTNGNRPSNGSTGTLAQNYDVSDSSAAQDVPQQLPLIQSVAEPAERNASVAYTAEWNATNVKQLNPAQPSDEGVAGEDQGAAPTTPRGTPQAGAGVAVPVNGENFKAPAGLPAAAALPSHGDWIQSAVKASAKETNNAADAKNPGLGSTTEPGKNKASDAVGTRSDGPSHGAQNSGQSTQHSQTDSSQGAAVAPKVIDSGTSQAQATPMHGVSHEAATPLRSGGEVEDASRQTLRQGEPASNESESGDAVASSGINAAKLMQTMGQTEMSVGMRSSEFGNISIRTSVSQQQMLAQISLDHGELSQALASHVSSVQTKLENEYGLHTSIEVNHQGTLSSGDSGNPAQREQQEFVRSARTASAAVAAEPETGLAPAAPASTSNGSRLDIRA